MVNRLKHRVQVNIWASTSEKTGKFNHDDALSEVIIDTWTKHQSGDFDIAASASYTLDHGDVAAVKGAYLEVTEECTLTINGSDTPIQLRKGGAAALAKFFIEADITSILITAGSEDLAGVYCLWGDATP